MKVDDVLYEINTDFRVAIECNKIAINEEIGDYERALAIIYKLFGKKGLDCNNQPKLLELAIKYLSFQKDNTDKEENKETNKNELDFFKCQGLIESSFKFDYHYNPYELEYLHWYDFYNDLQNLSTSEFGNCCALNRVASILNEDVSQIKDVKTRTEKLKNIKELRKRYCIEKIKKLTKEQEESASNFYKSLGINI